MDGRGSFRGNDATQPFLGSPGKLELASETRLETIIPRGLEQSVLQAMKQAHPYEEVAYDLYPVEQAPASVGLARGLGYGFWGDFSKPRSFSEVSRGVKRLFDLDGFWVTEPPGRSIRQIQRIGFVAGKGASFVGAAAAAGCDLFITGEAGYHTALDGARRGMAVMEIGHRESETFFTRTVKGWLSVLDLKTVELDVPTQKLFKSFN
jgi:putative NIF3 family GTP cyclohydrolase 1 type 2